MKLITKSGEELTLDQLIERGALFSKTSSGEAVTPQNALRSPTVFAIVNRLSSMYAQLPFAVVQNNSDGAKMRHDAVLDHPVTRLIETRPNQWQSPYQFKAHMMSTLLLNGFYVGEIGRAGGDPKFVAPLDAAVTQIEQNDRRRLLFRTSVNGQSKVLTQDQVLYIASPVSLDGITGVSPVQQCKEAIALEIAAEKFGSSLFGSGAVPSLILTRRNAFYDDDSKNAFKKMWDSAFRKNRGTAVLEGDEWNVEQVQMTNEDSQFLDTRKLQRSIIAGAFNVPPHMVGDLDRATFSNISSQALEVLMYTLAPWLECIEASVNRDLLTPDEVESERLFARFDTKRLLRGDLKTTADFLSKLRQWGFISANDGRAMLDMNAREDEAGDDYITPIQYIDQDESPIGESDEDDDGSENGGLRAVP